MTTTVGTAADRTEGRGRDADAPSAIPPHGWLDILRRTMTEFSSDRILAVAAGVTFYALLAIFPGLAALVSLIGFFADPAVVSAQLNSLSGIVPGGATDIIGNQVERLSAQTGSSLSFALVFGIAVALWSASSGMKAMFDALNVVYGEHEKRSFVELSVLALAFTIGALVFLLLAFGAVVVLPIALSYLGLGDTTQLLIQLLRWPLLFAAAALALAAFYRFGPSREDAEWRWISWQRACRAALGGRLRAVLLVRAEFRQLQRNLRVARRGDRLHDLDVAVGDDLSPGRRTQFRDRAPDGARHHHRTGPASRGARRDGRR